MTSASSGSVTNPYRYGGKFGYYSDDHTGILLAGARWYHPQIGRWLTRDPIEYEGGFNLFEYVRGRPVNYVDPEGLDGWKNAGNFASGFGDSLSLGGSGVARRALARRLFGPDTGDPADADSAAYDLGMWAGLAWGCGVGRAAWLGQEIRIGKNIRIAPFGNRTGHPEGQLPHYHRRSPRPDRSSERGQGIKRHRPWEKKESDRRFTDRF